MTLKKNTRYAFGIHVRLGPTFRTTTLVSWVVREQKGSS